MLSGSFFQALLFSLYVSVVFICGSIIELDSQQWTFSHSGNLSGKAQVPGDIYSDLYANKLISNPYYADNDIKLKWVPRTDWSYKATLNVPENVLRVVFLYFFLFVVNKLIFLVKVFIFEI
jgi:hypothetical protein